MTDFNKHIIISREMKGKKGDGMSAIFVLLKDLAEFQDKVLDAVEAQAIKQHQDKVLDLNNKLDEMYSSLLEIVEGGLRERRGEIESELAEPSMLDGEEAIDGVDGEVMTPDTADEFAEETEEVDISLETGDIEPSDIPRQSPIAMINYPVVPKM